MGLNYFLTGARFFVAHKSQCGVVINVPLKIGVAIKICSLLLSTLMSKNDRWIEAVRYLADYYKRKGTD